ncbi:hypothetical protein BF3285c1_1611 [Brucella vulpis]|nr:hypothetical protein BF3285c1_1611 [Brucella vulpis]
MKSTKIILQIDEKPLDFWQQSKTRGFDSDLFTF